VISLEELNQEKKKLEKKIKEINRKISQHPDTIPKEFVDREDLRPLIESLHFLERTSGWTDSRKNPMEWNGYRYSFKGEPRKIYCTRYASNWCHEFRDCGVEGESLEDLSPSPYQIWEENEEDDDKSFAQILEMPRHKSVAYALWFTVGW